MPQEIASKYPQYIVSALNADDGERSRERQALRDTLEQMKRLIDGRPDISNEAIFDLKIEFIPATDAIVLALIALFKK
jgi:hypothetical protein